MFLLIEKIKEKRKKIIILQRVSSLPSSDTILYPLSFPPRNYWLALASRDERSNAIVTDALYSVSRLVRFVLINFTVPDPTEVLTDVKTVRVVNEVRPSGRQAGRSSFTEIIRRGKGVKRMGKSAR